MKIVKRLLLVLLVILIAVVWYNFPRLNIISGYSAKSMSSSVFIANRSLEYTDVHDNSFSSISIAEDAVDKTNKSASASVYGFMKRTAIYKEGLGSILINDDFDPNKPMLIPQRQQPSLDSLTYPYGNLPKKDTIFTNINYQKIEAAISKHFDSLNKTRAVLVIYKDHIIGERYLEGMGEDSKFLGWSMTKSIIGTCFGLLQAQGKIEVRAKAPIEAWKNDSRKDITIHNLLQMNSGLEWDEDYNTMSDVTKMLFLDTNMTKRQAEKPFAGKPNESWNYSSGTTNMLSGILRKQFKTHQEYLNFPYRELIDKIGMYSMLLETDMSGNFVGSSYSWATTRDWAKFGLLYLHNGTWNGQQLFDKAWVDYIRTPTNTSNGQYGAQFWLNAGEQFPKSPRDLYFCSGFQGQKVIILPSQDMVIVRFGLKEVDFDPLISTIVSAIE